ncbi:POK7 protein, partial [Neodrepanis coruscans]|nr:POK7 protein [Neodrepanis coruscans]
NYQKQPIWLQTDVQTSNDLQKLLGCINWIRPYLGVVSAELEPLFRLLRGDKDLSAP